jgi:Cu+-exporting ATPase
MKTTRLKIVGMHCAACVERVEKALEAIPGVKAADVKLEDITTIDHDGVDEQRLVRAVSDAGDYKASVVREDVVLEQAGRTPRSENL